MAVTCVASHANNTIAILTRIRRALIDIIPTIFAIVPGLTDTEETFVQVLTSCSILAVLLSAVIVECVAEDTGVAIGTGAGECVIAVFT